MSPEAFVATLRDLGVGGVVAGRNYRFGFKAAGDADALTELGEKFGVEVAIVDLLDSGEEGTDGDDTPQVSSTRVRACLASGDVAQASRLSAGRTDWRSRRSTRRRGGDAGGVSTRDGDVSVPGEGHVRRGGHRVRRWEASREGDGDGGGGGGGRARRRRRLGSTRGVGRLTPSARSGD